MQKVAKFEKVSFENFAAAYLMFKGPTNIEIIKKMLYNGGNFKQLPSLTIKEKTYGLHKHNRSGIRSYSYFLGIFVLSDENLKKTSYGAYRSLCGFRHSLSAYRCVACLRS